MGKVVKHDLRGRTVLEYSLPFDPILDGPRWLAELSGLTAEQIRVATSVRWNGPASGPDYLLSQWFANLVPVAIAQTGSDYWLALNTSMRGLTSDAPDVSGMVSDFE